MFVSVCVCVCVCRPVLSTSIVYQAILVYWYSACFHVIILHAYIFKFWITWNHEDVVNVS